MPRAYTEEDIHKALSRVRGGCSIRKASRDFGIPRSTITTRLLGGRSRKEALAHHQILSLVEENHLITWVMSQIALGVPPTQPQLVELVNQVLHARGEPSIGQNWIHRFLKRHPEFKRLWAEAVAKTKVSNGVSIAVNDEQLELRRNLPPAETNPAQDLVPTYNEFGYETREFSQLA